MATLSLKNINKIYPNGTQAVFDFNLEIKDKEFICFVGPSGCGKSTTLRMIAGLEDISAGELWIDDRMVNDVSPKDRDIAMVFQSYALYPHMSVYENMAFGLRLRRIDRDVIKEKVKQAAEILGLTPYLERKPRQLSGGQCQRVALGRAIVRDAKVFLMDEPLSNLDARLRLQTREEIKRIQVETGITTIFVTHDQEEAMSICDSILVMKEGVVQQMGNPQEIYDDPANLFVANFLGTPPINIFRGVIKDHGVYIDDEKIMDTNHDDQEVYVAIRPEGYIFNDNKGVLTLQKQNIEVMGRDKSIVSKHAASTKPTVRTIIDSDIKLPDSTELKFDLKPNKVFIFNKDSEMRLR